MIIELTDEQRLNLLTSALEGGSNYWYMFSTQACNLIENVPQLPTKDNIWKDTFVWKLWSALKAGLEIIVSDIDTDEELGIISMNTILTGEQTMCEKYGQTLGDILSDNDDATTGDIWFQLAVMNEIVFG